MFIEVPGIGQFGPGEMPGELLDFDPREDLGMQIVPTPEPPAKKPVRLTPVRMIDKLIGLKNLNPQEALEAYEKQLVDVATAFPEHLREAQEYLTELRCTAYVQKVWAIFADEKAKKGTQWVSLYVDYAAQLRRIMKLRTSAAESARELLAELYLAQTQPGEPYEDDRDSYTGELFEVEPFVKFNKNDTDMDDPELMSFIASGDFQGDFFDRDHEWQEAGEMTSVTINQNEKQELRLTDQLGELRGQVADLLALLREKSREIRAQVERELGDLEKQEKGVAWTREGLELREEHLQQLVQDRVVNTGAAKEFMAALAAISRDYEPQDVLIVFHSAIWLDSLASQIMLANGMDLATFDEIHGDAILEMVADPVGWRNPDPTYRDTPLDTPYAEPYFDQFLEKIEAYTGDFEREYLESCPLDDVSVPRTRAFNQGMMDAILAGASINEAISAGWDNWRVTKSTIGTIAYELALSIGWDMKAAMTEFWRAAYDSGDVPRPRDRIVAVSTQGITLKTGTSNYQATRQVSWSIARLKAEKKELVVPKDADLKLKQLLFAYMQKFRWTSPQMASVKA